MVNGHNKRWWAAGLIQAHANATFGRAFLCGWTILQPAMPAGEAFASYFFYVCVWRGISLLGFLFQWNNQRTPPKKREMLARPCCAATNAKRNQPANLPWNCWSSIHPFRSSQHFRHNYLTLRSPSDGRTVGPTAQTPLKWKNKGEAVMDTKWRSFGNALNRSERHHWNRITNSAVMSTAEIWVCFATGWV